MISIEYALALVKDPKDADITLRTGGGDMKGLLIRVPRDIDETHPKYEGEVVNIVNDQLMNSGIEINGYDVRTVRTAHNIPRKGDFVWVFDKQGGRTRYSDSFVKWLVMRGRKNGKFFHQARGKAHQVRKGI